MQSLESKTQEAILKIIKMCTAEDIKNCTHNYSGYIRN